MSLPSPGPCRSHSHSGVCPKCPGCPRQSKVLSGHQQHCIWQARVKGEGTSFPMDTSSSITYPRSWELGSIPFICQGISETPISTTLNCFTSMTFSLKQLLHSATNNLKTFRFLFQFTACVRQKNPNFLAQWTVKIPLGNPSSMCPWKSWLVFKLPVAQGWKKRILEA